MKLPAWLAAPWTDADRRAEQREITAVQDDYAARELFKSGPRVRAEEEVRERYRLKRLRVRALATVALVVAVAAFMSAFHEGNRLLEGVRVGATSAAVPVALLLAFRRDQ